MTAINFVHGKFSENYCVIKDKWCNVNHDEVRGITANRHAHDRVMIMNNSGQCFLLVSTSSLASLRACSPTSPMLVPLFQTLWIETQNWFVMTATHQLTSKENATIYGIHIVMKFIAVSCSAVNEIYSSFKIGEK